METQSLQAQSVTVPSLIPRLIPIDRLEDFLVWPSANAARHLIRNLNTNGCAEHHVFVRPAGRWLLDTVALAEWVESRKEEAAIRPRQTHPA